jgi:hypothetical protein
MITGKINLMYLKASRMTIKGKLGPVECVVLPIELNKLFVGEKGIYLDLIAFELKEKNPERKNTHLVKQSFSKEDREAMTEEQRKAIPIIGSLTIGDFEQEGQSDMTVIKEDDGLPF